MKQKGFTLIELLVVVAIIGILAAVGVTTFNGFQEKAKISTIKANFKMVTKYIPTELMKCDLGDEYFFNDADRFKLICGTGQHPAGSVASSTMYMLDSSQKGYMDKSSSANKGSNVMIHDRWIGQSIPDDHLGHIIINSRSWPMIIRSCFKTPCSDTKNFLSEKIYSDQY